MDSDKLNAFLKAIQIGSLTAAAEKIGYTQAGLTNMMNRLEKEMGINLLKRGKSGVEPTDEAMMLMPAIVQFTSAGESLNEAINAVKNGDRLLKISAYPEAARNFLPHAESEFKKVFPAAEFRVELGSVEKISESVSNGSTDLGFISFREKNKGEWIQLFEDNFLAILPPDSDCPEKIELEYFNGKEFFLPCDGIGDDISVILEKAGVKPKINPCRCDSIAAAAMTSAGLGCCILSEFTIPKNTPCRVIPIKNEDARKLGILIKSKKKLNPVAVRFISCCKNISKNDIL
ncbi:MAG: LysR family transcriptional regulator [Clostridia bacterium]|nr:LysR family transcriptional regulator [Clostridia bacterium]